MTNILEGIDVSEAQAKNTWYKVAQSGKVFFAFTKATQGRTYVDKQFKNNWVGIKESKLLRGAYHFASGSTNIADAIVQADHFIDTLESSGGTDDLDMLVLDMEVAGNLLTTQQFNDWVLTFLERINTERSNFCPDNTSPYP